MECNCRANELQMSCNYLIFWMAKPSSKQVSRSVGQAILADCEYGSKFRMTRQCIKLFISMQYRHISANSHCHYKAINQFSHLISSAATDSKQHRRVFIVNRLGRKHDCCSNQFQNLRLLRNSSRSPVHPNPRKRRASSTLSGSIASERSAKFTASCLVEKRNRFMTAAQAFSSISIVVRDIQHITHHELQMSTGFKFPR